MSKIIALNYTLDASEKKITFTDYNPIVIERVLLITNITDNVIIYNFSDPTLGGTAATNVLTLTYDTSSMSDTDKLQIFYDDVATTQLVSGTVTADLSATDNAVLDNIDTNTDSCAVVGNGAAATAQRVTLANDSTGIVALTTSSAVIGKLASNTGVDIGDVDVLSLPAITGTVTANLSATDNAVLDTIDSVLDTINAKLVTGTVIGDVNLGATDNAVLDAVVATLGATSGAAVITDANGTIQQYLRGLVTLDLVDNAVLDAIALGFAAEAGAVTTGVLIQGDDGTDRTNVLVDTAGHLQIDVLTNVTHPVTNAGTFAVQVDGNALTSLNLIDDAIYATDGALNKSMVVGAIFDDVSPVAITENQGGYLRMSSRRALLVEGVASGTALNVLDTNSAAALTALQLIDNAISGAGFNITQFAGAAVPIGAGLEATAVRVTLPTDGTGVVKLGAGTAAFGKLAANSGIDIGDVDILSIIPGVGATNLGKAIDTALGATDTGVLALAVRDDTLNIRSGAENDCEPLHTDSVGALWSRDTVQIADDAAFTVATSRVMPLGLMADETSTDSVDEGDTGIPRMTLDRKQIVTVYPSATGEGLDIFKSIDLDETEEDIKGSAGKIYGYYIYNNAAATTYVRFYNATAANTTVGTTASILVLPIPAGAAANCSFTNGIPFSTALCAAATTGVADNDTGAPAANTIIIDVLYK